MKAIYLEKIRLVGGTEYVLAEETGQYPFAKQKVMFDLGVPLSAVFSAFDLKQQERMAEQPAPPAQALNVKGEELTPYPTNGDVDA